MHLFKKILLPCCFLTLMYATNEQESYIFEAKGEFAKELKALVEKYSKDSNVSINVYENIPKTQSGSFLNIGIDNQANYSAKRGGELYAASCARCHGEKGEKKASIKSRKLINLSADDIENAFSEYSSDPEYGGQLKDLMRTVASSTSYNDLGDIIVFLKGKEALKFINSGSINQNTDVSVTPAQGSYLK